MTLFTIGHSNHSLEHFASLLEQHGIQVVVDVRSAPYSKYASQFNKEMLESGLRRRGIQYIYEGKHLGGRPEDPSCYKTRHLPAVDEEVEYLHEVDYPAVMQKPWFEKAIERVLKLAEDKMVAVMCSEEDPANCHRHHLIAKYLMEWYPDVKVTHIRGDGQSYNAASITKSVNDEPGEQLSLLDLL
jgi:uncharacterized protein (DUF488 family)